MQQSQKNEIKRLLDKYIEQYPSQAKAVNSLKNISEATIINIRKGNWDSVSDEMFRKVGLQVGYSAKGAWNLVETEDFKTITTLLDDAKEYSNVFAITAPSGAGKTFTASYYERNNNNVYHIVCAEYFNRKIFLARLLDKMGKDSSGSVSDMMDTIIETLMKQDSPLIILDEADKLNDTVLYFFITLYNMLHGKCGIVLIATDYLSKRIIKGRKMNRKGYNEIFSRVGRRFITLDGTDEKEVAAICEANGLTDPTIIKRIYNECEGDLRRVERGVHRTRKQVRKITA